MAITLEPAPLPPGAGEYPLEADCLDEGFAPTGAPRHPFAEVLDALAQHDLGSLRERVRSDAAAVGLNFGPGRPVAVDPVPRVIDAAEWERLEAGLGQRARALNAFLADAYGDQRIFAEGVVPRRLLETSAGYEPRMRGLLDPELPAATVAGLDLVRDPAGEMRVLEDNLRMPSGSAYAAALREIVAAAIGQAPRPRVFGSLAPPLGEALDAAGGSDGRSSAVLLSPGSESGAWFEHRALADELGIAIAVPADLETSRGRLYVRAGRDRAQVGVVYRRLDEERLTDPAGDPTPLGELLLPALEAGRLRCLNAFGTGLADDKLAHAYVERMIRFYLGEEPSLPSVPSFDLGEEAERTEAMARIEDLVVKPRGGFGGEGVTIMPRATAGERRRTVALLRRRPESFVAQEMVSLSSHPTVCGGRLEPRRVDLRPFVVSAPGGISVPPGGLTRFARGAGEMIVNSSRGGGCKDTWVMRR
jgi:uncharacterized circularly permuted ATP-grasp superfamily protein